MLAPWNLYPARNADTNSHIEVECFNLLKPDGTIPLGLHHSIKTFMIKLYQLTLRVELFLFSYPVGLKAYFTGAETISPEAAYGERSKRV